MKYAEKVQPKEELSKTTIESANISLDALKETVETLQEHCSYLTGKVVQKREEIDELCIQVERLEFENKILKHKIDELEEELNALRN